MEWGHEDFLHIFSALMFQVMPNIYSFIQVFYFVDYYDICNN